MYYPDVSSHTAQETARGTSVTMQCSSLPLPQSSCGLVIGNNSVQSPNPSTSTTSSSALMSRPSIWNPMNMLRAKRNNRNGGSKGKQPTLKRRKVPTWTHTFVCLASKESDCIPEADERAMLHLAGLGEKKIQLFADSDANDIHYKLIDEFPKLTSAGGYELLRSDRGMKLLVVIDVPSCGYNVSYLKTVAHNAKIYIRPLQKDLSVEVDSSSQEVS